LIEKIGTVGKLIGKPQGRPVPPAAASALAAAPARAPLVLLGASTGGPNALAVVLAGLPKTWDASIIIVQHVDAAFAPGLAQWLGEKASRRVTLVTPGGTPVPGETILAATNDHLFMDAAHRLRYVAEPVDLTYRPSVDVFFSSVAKNWSGPGVAVVLTGMGRDGAAGLLKLRREGWLTLAQDEATCVVWGMPRAAAEVGAAVQVLPVEAIAPAIVDFVRKCLST
jgi:two-component system response regulator WspF